MTLPVLITMPSPVLITGTARSGTSMIAGIVSLCGAFGGKLSGPSRFNQKGMFENIEIRNYLVKKWLRGENYDAMGQYPLPDTEHCKEVAPKMAESWRANVKNIMHKQGYVRGPWFYKGAKSCLMWPIWALAFPEARWLIVRRNDEDIARSCLRTGFMRAYRDLRGWLWWVQKHKERFQEMAEAGLMIREVWAEKIVRGELKEIREAIDWLGMDWNEKEVIDFVVPGLWGRGKYDVKLTR